MIVLDASVMLKWFIAEVDSEKATIFRNKYLMKELDIVVPDLLFYEVASALGYKRSVDIDEINLIILSLFDFEIKVATPNMYLLRKAIFISQNFDVSLYDSVYLALAIELDYSFITADEKFYKKVISKDNQVKIKLLKNIIIN